jgi:hypothetical protein
VATLPSTAEVATLAEVSALRAAPLSWTRWDRERLQRTGGTLEQYKHPCLIGDHEFHQGVRRSGDLLPSGQTS